MRIFLTLTIFVCLLHDFILSYYTVRTICNKKVIKLNAKNSNFDEKFNEIAEPLLDLKLVAKTIEEWSRPLPPRYLIRPLVFVGPSGVGKGRLISALLKDYSRFFKKVTTHTTRQPRPDELERLSYYFVNNSTFHTMVHEGRFLEWAKVHNNYYGTTVDSLKKVQEEGKIPILEIDIQGAKNMKNISLKYDLFPKYLFIKPADVEHLRERLIVRATETEDEMKLRLQNALIEIDQSNEKDLFDSIIINDNIEMATRAFFRIIRDWYPSIPSAARIRMLQRRVKNIKNMILNNTISATSSFTPSGHMIESPSTTIDRSNTTTTTTTTTTTNNNDDNSGNSDNDERIKIKNDGHTGIISTEISTTTSSISTITITDTPTTTTITTTTTTNNNNNINSFDDDNSKVTNSDTSSSHEIKRIDLEDSNQLQNL